MQLIDAVALHVDGRRAVSASQDGTLRVRDLDSGTCLRALKGHTRRVVAVALHADGCRAVSPSEDGTLIVWDLAAGNAIARWTAAGAVTTCAVSVAGRIVAGDAAGDVTILEPVEPA